MKMVYVLLFLYSLAFVSIGQTIPEIAKTGIKSTVSIIALDKSEQPLGYGSGFIISNELVATNVHVIEGSTTAYVLLNGQEKKYKIDGYVSIDRVNDLVILKVSGLYGDPLPLASENLPDIGEKIFAVGNPKGLNGTFSEGIVSGIRTLQANPVLQITAPISPGSSGGPVLNSSSKVVGIAFASFKDGQNLNFAIPVKFLINLKTAISTTIPISGLKIVTKSTTTAMQEIKNGVTIRNIIESGTFTYTGKYYVFSIKNNLNTSISNIKILFLAYDASGTIIDYNEYVFPGEIKPLLAKAAGEVFLDGKVSKIKTRILDFQLDNNDM